MSGCVCVCVIDAIYHRYFSLFSTFFDFGFHHWLAIDFVTNERLYHSLFSQSMSLHFFVCANDFFEIENNFSDFYKW